MKIEMEFSASKWCFNKRTVAFFFMTFSVPTNLDTTEKTSPKTTVIPDGQQTTTTNTDESTTTTASQPDGQSICFKIYILD